MKTILWLLVLIPLVSQAHNVVGTAYVVADTIEGEVGFSNGDMAAAGMAVTVYNAVGDVVGQTETNADGAFEFSPNEYTDYLFVVDLGSGHKIELSVDKADLPTALIGMKSDNTPTNADKQQIAIANNGLAMNEEVMTKLIETAVAKQLKPLRNEINELKNKTSLQSILGALGYILGLVGFGLWLTQRKQAKQTK